MKSFQDNSRYGPTISTTKKMLLHFNVVQKRCGIGIRVTLTLE